MSHKYTIIFWALMFLFSCENKRSGEEKQVDQERNETLDHLIAIEPDKLESDYPDAIMEMIEPAEYERLEPGNTTFSYNIKNFALSSGASIVVNLNNAIFIENDNVKFHEPLPKGNYFSVTYLTNEGQSLKNYGNYVVRSFSVGAFEEQIDDTLPMLIYNQPRGRIRLDEDRGALLDFIILNADLSSNDYQVKAEIGGKEFLLYDWRPYRIKGLSPGDHHLKLSLIDSGGRLPQSAFSQVEMNFTLH